MFLVSLFASDSCILSCFAQVAPPSAHAVISSAAKFLLNWLFEYQHEYQQWSAAISLGLVSNCLHATDKQLKFEVITGLLKVDQSHRSTHIWRILFMLQSLYAKLPAQIYPRLLYIYLENVLVLITYPNSPVTKSTRNKR